MFVKEEWVCVSGSKEAAYLFSRDLSSRREQCKFIVSPACSENRHPDKVSSKKWRFYFERVARDYWQLTWLHAALLFHRPIQVRPDSLYSDWREKSPATCVEYVSCTTSLCEWSLNRKINTMSNAKRSHLKKHFFISIYSLWIKYWLLTSQSIILCMRKGLIIRPQEPSCRAIMCAYACVS
jgi:hypothetical protein